MKKTLLLASVMLLAGCYTMDIGLKINPDDSGTTTFSVSMPYMPPEEGPDTTMQNLRTTIKGMAQGKKGAKLLKYTEELSDDSSTITMTAKYRFKDFNEFFSGQDEGYAFRIDSNGKLKTLVCNFEQDSLMSTDLPKNATAEDSSAAAMAELSNMFLTTATFNVIIEIDGKIISHNADSIKQNKIYWSVPFYDEKPETKTLTVKYKVK